ncbi:hypothetical protein NT6N_37100 [Oceaniferula spumae]|uniref:L,D-TPase catalytic domain-containing protein n=1 Tax=Oceaniferula spumae TaxID=2979115 RepID=A0AAT9FRM2_9BACT
MCRSSDRSYPLIAALLVVMCLGVSFTSCRQAVSDGGGASGRALLDSVKLGDDQGVAVMLEEGVYTEVRDKRGDTPLLFAVKTGNVRIARMLLSHGADHETRSGNGKGPLELALDAGSQEMAVCLLKGGVSPDEIGRDNNPLLLKAVSLRDYPVMKLLLKNGVNPNAAGKDGSTPLHVAAEQRLPKCLDILLKAGADTETKDDEGATPLWYAMNSSPKSSDNQTVSHQQSSSCLEILLNAGADASAIGPKKTPLLCEAIRRGASHDALELINYGANVDLPGGEDGMTPLAIAAATGSESMVATLLSRGADGGSLLYEAVESEDVFMLGMLLSSGVPLSSWDGPEKDTLIAHSVRKANYDMSELFLRYGAKVNSSGSEGQHPLHMAIAMRDAFLVNLLLNHGADTNKTFAVPASKEFLAITKKESMQWFLKNERRLTPLMMATNNGDLEIIKSLLRHGAKKYVWSGRHRLYPLNFASRRSDVKAMQVILGQDPDNEKFHAVLDLSEQRVRLYNPAGEVIFSSRVSTGKSGFRTPTGTYVISDKHRHHNSSIYGSSMPYFQRLSCSAFGFHYGNCPGYPASHGCIRMPYSAAKKLFSITPVGTRVVIRK